MILPSDGTQQQWARIAGAAYLANYLTAVLGVYGMTTIRGAGEFADRAARLAASEPLYRAALTSMAVSWVILTLQAYALYITLKPVNRHVATLGLLLQGSQAVVGAVSVLFGFTILRIYVGAATGGALSLEQLQGLRSIVNGGYDAGWNVAMLFFSPASLLFFYLFYKSAYLPRWLAAMGVIGSALMILLTVLSLIRVPLQVLTIIVWVPMGVAEVVTAFWLAFRGIRISTDSLVTAGKLA
jgi:hypothetical protein